MLNWAWRRQRGTALLCVLGLGVAACGSSQRSKGEGDTGGESTTSAGGSGTAGSSGTGGSSSTSGAATGGDGGATTTASTGGGAGSGGSGGSGGSAGSGGSGGAGGDGGSGGTLITVGPVTSVPLAGGELEKLDILFVIDNSISMADKQQMFQTGVPTLVERLINPVCVQSDDASQVQIAANPSEACPDGFEREFAPLTDVHVGIISTSLGGHGGDICSPNGPNAGDYDPSENDRGLLIPTVRDGLDSYEGLGFLAWDPNGTKSPAGEADHTVMIQNFQDQVVATGEVGCGYESTLEAWYRFLVDPAPPAAVVVENGVADVVRDDQGAVVVDQEVLDQRAQFLRPDSVVAIVMLTDENDCSIVDGGIGYLTATAVSNGLQFSMPESTTACDEDPNSICCRSCALAETAPPPNCMALGEDPKCIAGRPAGTDALNLRCHHQKQRFGFDLLYPVQRYIDGLTQPSVYDTHNCEGGDCPLVDNPLFVSEEGLRSASRVVLTGIIGVPWQDIATQESLDGGPLRYMSPEQLVSTGRWDLMLGDPNNDALATDPLMIETPAARTGTHPLTGESLAPADSTNPQANSINGHEYDNSTPDDLQYACIFPLETPKDCSSGIVACDCTEADVPKNRPLCNPPGGGAAGTTQYYGKAYPGLRHLEVIRGLGTRAMPASICPKVTSGSSADPEFGYNPAVDAIIRRVEAGLGSSCVPELPAGVTDDLSCRVIEVGRDNCDCEGAGRRPIPDAVLGDVEEELEALCDAAGGIDCSSYCACEILPLAGDDLEQCTTELEPASGDGWCYVSPGQGVGAEDLVEHCPDDSRRTVRVIGAAADTYDTELRLLCQ